MEQITEQKIYPTTADENGFYYDSAEDEALGILTKEYDNGNKIKGVTLSTGEKAVMRMLKAKDTKDISRFMDKDPERYQHAAITVATTFDEKRKTIEDIENMWMRDFNKLMSMYQDLNS